MQARLEVAHRTDPGLDPEKQVNEDSVGYHSTRLGHLLVVCDGMGGHAGGREASQLAVATILRMVDNAPQGTSAGAALVTAIGQAGRVVYDMGGAGPQMGRPGSTCVAVLIHSAGTEVAHVGDSRAYFVRKGQIWQISKDHSVVQQMVDQGALTPEQAAVHPEANKITRALGMKPETDVELRDPPILHAVGDVFVLASDGLCDLVRTDEIGAVVAKGGKLELACEELIRMANARGGHDNITVQLARVLPSSGSMAVAPGPVAPTLVEARGAGQPGEARAASPPEPTLVDRSPVATVPLVAAAPVVPTGAKPAVPTTAVTPAAAAPAPPQTPRTVPPGPPSRSGVLVLVLGFAVVGLILAGVVAWWILREPR